MNRILAFLARSSAATITGLSFLILFLVAALDYMTTVEVSLLTFYWIPVSLITWYQGRSAGMCMAALSVAIATLLDVVEGHVYGSQFFLAWDLLSRLASFVVFVWVLGQLRSTFHDIVRHRERLEELVAERTADLTMANQDLTAARERAEAANRTKDAFLANMTHEFRTPLNAVIGFSEVMRSEAAERADTTHLVELNEIHSAGQRMLDMIDDVLEIARLETMRTAEMTRERVDARVIVREIVTRVQARARSRGNQIDVSLPDEEVAVEVEPRRMWRALFHILSNACKFTENGVIQVVVRVEGDRWVSIKVTDSGIGISSEHLDRIFAPFTQVDDSYTRRYGGTGLGLAVARRFSELMGGSLEVVSVPDRGATFEMRLPRTPPEGRVIAGSGP